MIDLNKRLADVRVVAIDLEMTGLDVEADRICEFGTVYGFGHMIHGRWNAMVQPGIPIGEPARALTGIEDSHLVLAPTFEQMAADVARVLEGHVCLAHAAPVDRAFLEAAFRRANYPMPEIIWLDTLALARNLLSQRSHKLEAVARAFGMSPLGMHRALTDAEATWHVGHRLLDLIDPHARLCVGDIANLAAQWAKDGTERRSQTEVIHRAIRQKSNLAIAYASRDDGGCWHRVERVVSPWTLTNHRLRAWCHLRDDARIFRLERIHDVTVAAQSPAYHGEL